MLVFEVAERHDIILRLKNEINDIEQQLKQKDTHIQFKDEIIKKLRQQRRSYLKVCHSVYCSVVVVFFSFIVIVGVGFFSFCSFIWLFISRVLCFCCYCRQFIVDHSFLFDVLCVACDFFSSCSFFISILVSS